MDMIYKTKEKKGEGTLNNGSTNRNKLNSEKEINHYLTDGKQEKHIMDTTIQSARNKLAAPIFNL